MSEPIITKRCSHCKQVKPISEFRKDQSRKDGYQYICKTCKYCIVDKPYKQSAKGKIAERRYRKTQNYKISQRRFKQSRKGKAANARWMKKFRVENPAYIQAIRRVNSAIRSGNLARPDTLQCHYCDAQAKQYHHHKGYAPEYWLDVVPVCKKCHRKIHLDTSYTPQATAI